MFCTKCGAQLEDGVKFCTVCGAPTKFAQTPAPEAQSAAPAEPTVPTPAQPQQPAAWTASTAQTPAAPAAPQANAWPQQPVQPQQPAQQQWSQPPQQPAQPAQQPGQWQQTPWPPQQPAQPQQPGQWPAQQPPQQPAQPQWQQQQPQQWQQIQQQWQQQQTRQQMAQQLPQQWQQQSRQQTPARGGAYAPPPKKRGKGGLIAGIIALVLVLVIGVGGFVWPGFFKKDKDGGSAGSISGALSGGGAGGGAKVSKSVVNGPPEEYFQAVETNSVDRLTAHAASIYDNFFLSNATAEDISASGKLSLEPGDKARELLLDSLGDALEQYNPGEDLKWLKSISAEYDVSRKDDLLGLNLSILINDKDLVHLIATLQEGGALSLSVPELSDKYMTVPMDDVDFSGLSSLGAGAGLSSVLGSLSPEAADKLGPISKAMPDAKTFEKLTGKYLKEAVDLVEKVEKKEADLTVEGVTEKYTVLTSTIDADTAIKIVQKLGPELKADKDVKKIIVDIATAAEADGEAKYQEFLDKLDEYINDPEKVRENMKNDLVITVYLDKNSAVHGRVLDNGKQKLEVLMPESGGQFGLKLTYTDEGTQKMLLTGSGKRSGDKLTGDLDLTVDGEYFGVIGLDGFDVEKVKDGYFVGALNIKPSASVWRKLTERDGEESNLPESIRSILDTLVFHVDMNTAKDKGDVTITVTNGSDKFFSIALSGAKGAAKKITPVEGVDASTWAQDISLDKLEKVVASLEKAGVPQAYTDMLDQALEESFS